MMPDVDHHHQRRRLRGAGFYWAITPGPGSVLEAQLDKTRHYFGPVGFSPAVIRHLEISLYWGSEAQVGRS